MDSPPICVEPKNVRPNKPASATKSTKAAKMLYKCEICAADSIYHYYGVQSCEGCKQFFRRIVVKQKDFKCWKTEKCEIDKGERCRSCRLDKCLLKGMDPKMVNIRRTPILEKFIIAMERRRMNLIEEMHANKMQKHFQNEIEKLKQLECLRMDFAKNDMLQPIFTPSECFTPSLSNIGSSSSNSPFANSLPILNSSILTSISPLSTSFQPMAPLPENTAINFKLLDSLLTMESNLKRIWFSNMDLAHSGQSPIANFLLIDKLDVEQFDEKDDNSSLKDQLFCIEMAKTMPFFERISADDQLNLLRHIIGPVTMLINAFNAFIMNAETWTTNSASMMNNGSGDEKIMKFRRQMQTESMAAFKKADIGREEFVLIMAILFASSTAPDLSKHARELLYDESVRHSKALLDLLQMKHGQLNGCQKYAIAIELISSAFHFHTRIHLLSSYTRALQKIDGEIPNNFEKIIL